MNEKQSAVLDSIKLAAGLEAQRIAVAMLNAAMQGGMLPQANYNVKIHAEIDRPTILTAPHDTVRHN